MDSKRERLAVSPPSSAKRLKPTHPTQITPLSSKTFQGLRSQLKEWGLKNSFNGANVETLQNVVQLHQAGRVPLKLYTKEAREFVTTERYQRILNDLTLCKLAKLVSDTVWKDYQDGGCLQCNLNLGAGSQRMAQLLTLVTLAEHGVDPTNASTYPNFGAKSGNDTDYGWHRNPAFSKMQYYLATHPYVYRTAVGLYARSLLKIGAKDDTESSLACLELSVQVYNSKLRLPGDSVKQFSHLDLDWRRGNFHIPAPQLLVATSPSRYAGQRIYSCDFVNCDTEDRLSAMREEAKSEDCRPPYIMPRTSAAGSSQYGGATKCPKFVNFDDPEMAKNVADVQFGDLLAFPHTAAHRFTQYSISMNAAQRAGNEPVPLELTRTAEYPSFVSRRLHGVLNQSTGEVTSARCDGQPPARWAHIYTGNMQGSRAANRLNPAFTPLPVPAHTVLARCLLGVSQWSDNPDAISWLVASSDGAKSCMELDTGVPDLDVMVALHDAMLAPTCDDCIQRLTAMSDMTEGERARLDIHQFGNGGQFAACDMPLSTTVPTAAHAALRHSSMLTPSDAERKSHQSNATVLAKFAMSLRAAHQSAMLVSRCLIAGECESDDDTGGKSMHTARVAASVDTVDGGISTDVTDGESDQSCDSDGSNDWVKAYLHSLAANGLRTLGAGDCPVAVQVLMGTHDMEHAFCASIASFVRLSVPDAASHRRYAGRILHFLFSRIDTQEWHSHRARATGGGAMLRWYLMTSEALAGLREVAAASTASHIHLGLRKEQMGKRCPHCSLPLPTHDQNVCKCRSVHAPTS